MAQRSILGAADVDDDAFTTIVARALGEHARDVRVTDCRAEVVDYSIPAITTAGRYWVTAQALTPAGQRSTRMFVKHVQAWSRSSFFQYVPEHLRAAAAATVPWRTEPLVYRSDLHRRLPAGLSMPRALHVGFVDELSATIWLPALEVVEHDWEVADFARAAYLLGRFAGSAAVAELTALGDEDGGPRTARTYAEGRVAGQVAPALRSAEQWQAPWLAEAFDAGLRADLLAALDAMPEVVDELEALPTAAAHGDACPNNLLTTAGGDDLTLIDFGFFSRQCVGFDLAQLVAGDVQLGRRPASALPATEAVCLPAYVAGLRAEGVAVDEAVVARAHALHLLLFTGLSAPLLDPPTPDADPAALDRDARERAAVARFSLDLVEATSG